MVSCRICELPIRDYVRVVPPGFTDFPINRIVELTASNWAVRTNQLSKFDPHCGSDRHALERAAASRRQKSGRQ
jgi:hypothetical protein